MIWPLGDNTIDKVGNRRKVTIQHIIMMDFILLSLKVCLLCRRARYEQNWKFQIPKNWKWFSKKKHLVLLNQRKKRMQTNRNSQHQPQQQQHVDTNRNRVIVHFDLDSFFVQVEKERNPALCGKPIAVRQHQGIIYCIYT